MSIANLDTELDIAQLFREDSLLMDFRKYLVPHRIFIECERAVLMGIAQPGDTNIFSVIGPSGVGKTQVLEEVRGTLLGIPAPNERTKAEITAELQRRPYLPVISVLAHTGRTYESRFRDLVIQIVRQVNGVAMEFGVVEEKASGTKSTRHNRSMEKLAIARLEDLAKLGCRERNVRAILIDEAQHLAQGLDNEDTGEWRLVGDGLKLLGSITGTPVVLFGTDELLRLPHLSGQLSRRSRSFHLRRYLWSSPVDLDEFQRAVAVFCDGYSKQIPMDLLFDNLPMVYTGCLGCIGRLSSWLHDALAETRITGVTSITLDVLKRKAHSEARLRKSWEEAIRCEKAFAEESAGFDKLTGEMCAEKPPPPRPELPPVDEGAATPAKTGKKGNRKPGNRNPTYDRYKPAE